MAYLGKTPSQAVRSRYYYTATGGETSLSGADDNSNVLTFTDGNYVDVSLNGATLVAGSDYNTTTANTIGGLAALTASDIVEIVVYDTFSVFGGNMAADLNFKDNVKANFGTGNDLVIYHDGSNSIINDAGTGLLKFQYGGTDGVVFDSSGNVGIGTVPSVNFHAKNASGNLEIRFDSDSSRNIVFADNNGTYDAQIEAQANGTLYIATRQAQPMLFAINNGEKMRIDSSGNVGIGVTPEAWNSAFPSVLQIGAGMALTTSGGDNARIFGNVYYDGSYKRITSGFAHQYEQTGGTHRWAYAATGAADSTISFSEAMRIDTSGNLLVGKTSAGLSNVGFQALSSGVVGITRSGSNPLDLNRLSSDGTLIEFNKDGTTVGSIGSASSGSVFDISGAANDVRITGGNASYWIDTNAIYAGNDASRDLGTSSFRWKDLYLSGGVYLGGTGSANKLDDYEEGATSGTLLANSGSFTTATYTGRYHKIGSLVNFAFEATITSIGSAVLGFVVPLPFTAAGTFGHSGSGRRMGDSVQFHTVLTDVYYVVARNTCTGGTINVNGETYRGSIVYEAV